MTRNQQTSLGAVLVVAGAVLALVLPDLEFLIFTGRPLGVVLVAVGILDLVEATRRPRRDRTPR